MTSKNSYWKLSQANFKRRIPFFVMSFLLCFLLMPVVLYFECASYVNYMNPDDHQYIVKNLVRDIALGGYVQDVVTIALAILFAVTGNAWNNSQKKNDFYKSLPVKESTRFIYIHVNSIISFVLVWCANLILANAVVACFGIYDGMIVTATVYSFFIHLLEFASVYMVAVIAQYLTGNAVLAVCGAGVLIVAEPVFRILIDLFRSQTYKTYVNLYHDFTDFVYCTFTSPVSGALTVHQSVSSGYDDFYVSANYSDIWSGVIKMLIQIVVYTAIAFYIYNRRPAQGGTKNIIFEKTKPFIKCLIMIPVITSSVILFVENGNNMLIDTIVGIVVSVIILHVFLQYAIEGDFAAVKRGLISTAVAGIVVVLTAVVFNVNGARYDKYQPARSDIESIAIATGRTYNYNFYENNGSHSEISSEFYFLQNVQITDEAYINEVLEIISRNIENDTYIFDEKWTEEQRFLDFSIAYNLKNGKRELRSYTIPFDDGIKVQYGLYDLDEFKHATNQLEYENNRYYIDNANKLEMVYHNYAVSVYDICALEERSIQHEMVEAMAKDYNARTSELYKNEIPIGYVSLFVGMESGQNPSFDINVYESDVNTLAVLAKMNYEPKKLDTSKIKTIEVYCCDYSEATDGMPKKVSFSSEDEIYDELLEHVVLQEAYYNSEVIDRMINEYDAFAYNEEGNSYNIAILEADKIKGFAEMFE